MVLHAGSQSALGRLHADKGIYDLLDALSQLRAAVPDVRLVCAGEGERAAVARYAERLGIGDAVKFTGWVGPSGKRALLESAAVCALPSYDEGMPLGLLEAMAAGVPVVATRVGGVPDIVEDGVSGILVEPGSPLALAGAIVRVLGDRETRERLAAGAAATADRWRQTPDEYAARLESLVA